MNAFEFVDARTLDEAVAAAAAPGAAYLAGGTNLVDLMKAGVARPARLVHIGRIEGLDRIETLLDGQTRIGALVRNSDLADLWPRYPLIAEATLAGASAQLRNAATVGGNLMQRTRCAYFFDPASACNKREPGAGCDMQRGETRGAAILGASPSCVATHPSDLCVALAALDAVVEIAGPAGRREIALDDFYVLPGDAPQRETELKPGELIVAVRLPAPAFASHARYLKARDRASYAFALASAAVALRLDGGRIAQARIALGGVAPKPWRAREAEASLANAAPGAEAFTKAAEIALQDARAIGDSGFRIDLARRVVARALTLAARGTPKAPPALPASPFGASA
jgi:xanthine dehydrogenase YagS FAD-binding subunit